ncbi:MAG: hypothetical protein V5804_00530 [Mucilaginibacter sp.]|uniref:hypothetical protein n=1 Tax=Mucilaginibacter sp. TaxID=1882438 RepID=UPI0034E3C6C9
MAIKIYLIVVLGIGTTIIFNSCGKNGLGCANTTYNFQIGENVTPSKDSIRISDTMYLNVNTLTKLKDLQSGNIVDYSNAGNLGNVVSLLRFLPSKKEVGAIINFQLIMLKGSKVNSIDPSTNQEVLFKEENGYYKFNMAIIPKDTGRYVITISNAANVYRKNDKCTKANFLIDFQSTDQHYNLFNLWRPDLTLDESGKKKVYYFKVYR